MACPHLGPWKAFQSQARRSGDRGRARPETLQSRVMTGLANDLRFALRTMVRSPAFALVAIATLALGIGANTAIFSVVDSVLLRPLPYPDPEAIVAVGLSRERGTIGVASQPDFRDWRARSRAFTEMAVFHD